MSRNFLSLVKNDSSQVFLLSCPACIPFSFALHLWFVINKQGVLSRWEVLHREVAHEKQWGHLYQDFFPAFQGIGITSFSKKPNWNGKLLGQIEGEIAEKIIEYIEKSPQRYPYCTTYHLTGPNSNTYIQWVLDNFPEWKITLPFTAFGKNYLKK